MTTPITYLADHFTYEQRISPPPTAYGQTASGYGKQIATDWLVRLSGEVDGWRSPDSGAGPQLAAARWPGSSVDGADLRWRRVYATCYSNAASLWINIMGQRFYFRDFDLSREAAQ